MFLGKKMLSHNIYISKEKFFFFYQWSAKDLDNSNYRPIDNQSARAVGSLVIKETAL